MATPEECHANTRLREQKEGGSRGRWKVRCQRMTFETLLDRYQTEILRYLVRMMGNRTDADDLFQEAFLRAFRAFDRLRANSNHRAWLYRIATNTCLNHRRTNRRRGEVEMLDESDQRLHAGHRVRATSVSVLEVRRALQRLSPRQRAAFVQRNLQGLSYTHIATALGCTRATARANVYQAAQRLKRELGVRSG